jgi:3-oxoacyl-[acyl-carrier-protein] synthase III
MLDRGPTPWRTGLPDEIGVKGLGWYLGERRPIDCIPRLHADRKLLQAFIQSGFCYYTRSPLDEPAMAVASGRESLRRSGLCPADIDAVVIGWTEHRLYDDMQERLGATVVRELGFHNVHVLGIGLAGCCLFAELVRTGRNLVVAEGYRNVLVIEVNRCPPDESGRVVPPDWFLYGDGAASCIVTREAPAFALRSVVHVNHALPMHTLVGGRCAIAHRTANSHATMARALRHAGVAPGDIRQYFFANVAPYLAQHYARRMHVPADRVFRQGVPLIAHPWSADTVVNLDLWCERNEVACGDRYAFFSWSEGGFAAMVLERTAHAMDAPAPALPPVPAATPKA